MFSFYTDMKRKEKKIRVFSNHPQSVDKQESVEIISCDITLGLITKKIEGKLFHNVRNLRIFSTEGIELFEEDLSYLKDQTSLIASNNGQDFNTEISMSEYIIQKNIGQGGFGKVMLAIHRDTKEKKAIKIVDAHRIGNAQDIELVFREAEMLKMLNHKNIVKIYNCFTLKNMKVAFIMDYLEGGDLLEYLENKHRIQENEAKEIFYQIADAILYCHHKKIIHRDLKLENIMFERRDSSVIKIVDFGIAGIQTNYNVDALDMGSLRYMSPEVLDGKVKKIRSEVDIWAMGVILYAIIYGSLPFSGKNSNEVKKCIIKGQFSFPEKPEVSYEAKNLIFQLLKINPQQRIKIQNILKHTWLNELHQQKIKYLWQELNAQNQMFNLDIPKEEDENYYEQQKLIKKININSSKNKNNGSKVSLKKIVQSGITLSKISRNLLFSEKNSEKFLPKIDEQKMIKQTFVSPNTKSPVLFSLAKKNSSVKISFMSNENSNEGSILDIVSTHQIVEKSVTIDPSCEVEKISNNDKQIDQDVSLPLIHPSPEKYQIKIIKQKLKDTRYYSPQVIRKNNKKHLKIQDPNLIEKPQNQRISPTFFKFHQLEQLLFQPRQTFQKITQRYYDTLQIINSNSIISKEKLLSSE